MELKNKTVIIPVYNEAFTIKSVIEGLKKVLSVDDEILVIDDGSTDDTVAIAKEAGAKVISHPYNIGNGAAVKTGLRKARGDIIITMDGDGQHDSSDIPKLLEHISNYDMVVGARCLKGQGLRGGANFLYNILASYVTGMRIKDLTSGFRAVRADIAKRYTYLLPNKFSSPTTITLAMIKSGHSVNYVPIASRERIGQSKIKPVRDGVRFLLIIGKIATIFSPFKIFVPVSFLFFFGGLLYYINAYITGTRFPNVPVLMIISGVILFMMGLIAEQIAQMKLERSEME